MKDHIKHSKIFLIQILLLPAFIVCGQQNLVPPVRAHHSLIYNDETKTIWLTGGSTPDKHRKKLIMFGGRLGWPNDINDTWEWDGSKWIEIKF